jgi:hypothetical protein
MPAAPNTSLNLTDFGAAPVPSDERRREERVACNRPIAVLPFCDDRFLYGRFIDCSPHGVGILVPKRLALDEQFMLKLRGESITLLIYAVRNCQSLEADFRIGGELCGCIGSAGNVADRAILRLLLFGQPVECL